jgi:hypothetical protein
MSHKQADHLERIIDARAGDEGELNRASNRDFARDVALVVAKRCADIASEFKWYDSDEVRGPDESNACIAKLIEAEFVLEPGAPAETAQASFFPTPPAVAQSLQAAMGQQVIDAMEPVTPFHQSMQAVVDDFNNEVKAKIGFVHITPSQHEIPGESFTEADVIGELGKWVEFGEQSMGSAHHGYFSGTGFGACVLRWLKADMAGTSTAKRLLGLLERLDGPNEKAYIVKSLDDEFLAIAAAEHVRRHGVSAEVVAERAACLKICRDTATAYGDDPLGFSADECAVLIDMRNP